MISVVSGAWAWQSYAAASPTISEDVGFSSVLSPRRIPQLSADLSQEVALRKTISDQLSGLPSNSYCVEVERHGRPVFSAHAGSAFIPASANKILTATIALNVFPSDHRFKTEVKSESKPKDGVVEGPLYLIGGGDPLLLTKDFVAAADGHRNIHSSLEDLADKVVDEGIKSIRAVVGDDSRFDDERYLSTWDPGYRTGGQVGPISALSVNQGFARASRVPEADPTSAAAAVFADLLKERGVTVREPAKRGKAPKDTHDLASLDSVVIGEMVSEMLTESDNTTAEVLLKNIGVQTVERGTFVDGTKAVLTNLRDNGFPITDVQLADGSGLDRSSRITCALLSDVLARGGANGALAGGLPKAGETGTLQFRFNGTPAVGHLQAKTGTLAGVSSLAGWARPAAQAPFNFVVMTNGLSGQQARTLEEKLALTLVQQPRTALAAGTQSPGVGQ